MAKLLNNKKLKVQSPKKVTLNNLQLGGIKTKEVFGNATVLFKANELIVKNATAEDLSCYNIFEHSWAVAEPKLRKIELVNCVFDSTGIAHNIVSVYCFEDNATITFKDCKFLNLNTNCNPIRLDNLAEAKNVTITFDNCEWNYSNVGGDNTGWLALVLLQPGDKTMFSKKLMADWHVVVKNCKFENELVKPEDFEDYAHLTTKYQTAEDQKAILYYYTNKLLDPTIAADKEFFPEVTIIANGNKKVFTA